MQLSGFQEVSEVLASGVYALVSKGEVVYVGKSKCMLTRVYSHRSLRSRRAPSWMPIKGIQFDQVFVLPVHVDRLDAVEREMINRYKPRHNNLLKNGLPVRLDGLTIAGVVMSRKTDDPPIRRRSV